MIWNPQLHHVGQLKCPLSDPARKAELFLVVFSFQ